MLLIYMKLVFGAVKVAASAHVMVVDNVANTAAGLLLVVPPGAAFYPNSRSISRFFFHKL